LEGFLLILKQQSSLNKGKCNALSQAFLTKGKYQRGKTKEKAEWYISS
jgi:hypothetical protein